MTSLRPSSTSWSIQRSMHRCSKCRTTERPGVSILTLTRWPLRRRSPRSATLGLANRKPRLIDLDDTLGADTVPATNYGSVLWGGERMEDEASWVRVLPDGTRYAFVVMEQRVWFRHTPVALGTPVQTFRASLEAGEKIGRDIAWSFNTETGEPIVASETIDLCFNLTERRSMALPAEIRAQEDGGYHPEFAPGLKAVR